MKVLVVFGTRPEAVKCAPVVKELQARPEFEVLVCVTAQHRQILDQVLELVDIVPDFDLHLMRAKPTLTQLTTDVLTGLSEVIEQTRPDRILVQGDTTTAMVAGLAGLYFKVPVGHIEAGLRTGDILSPWPEEANRRIVATLADLHFAPTSHARANLVAENIPPDKIVVTGNTVIDALYDIRRRLDAIRFTNTALESIFEWLERTNRRLILLTFHRREKWGDGVSDVCRIARAVADRGDVQIVYPVHPNPHVRVPVQAALSGHDGISLIEPLDYLSFVDLLGRCDLILSDSGGLQEEAAALSKPLLVLRDKTERPEGIAAGSARLVGTDPAHVIAEVERLLDDPAACKAMSSARNPYGDGHAAKRIVATIGEHGGIATMEASR
jgi:UDP-N-acetylglucosamine 2-epimerase (non-hydrolysing)